MDSLKEGTPGGNGREGCPATGVSQVEGGGHLCHSQHLGGGGRKELGLPFRPWEATHAIPMAPLPRPPSHLKLVLSWEGRRRATSSLSVTCTPDTLGMPALLNCLFPTSRHGFALRAMPLQTLAAPAALTASATPPAFYLLPPRLLPAPFCPPALPPISHRIHVPPYENLLARYNSPRRDSDSLLPRLMYLPHYYQSSPWHMQLCASSWRAFCFGTWRGCWRFYIPVHFYASPRCGTIPTATRRTIPRAALLYFLSRLPRELALAPALCPTRPPFPWRDPHTPARLTPPPPPLTCAWDSCRHFYSLPTARTMGR